MEVVNFGNRIYLSDKDAEQMINAIKAYQEGKTQPEGRFKIIKELKNE